MEFQSPSSRGLNMPHDVLSFDYVHQGVSIRWSNFDALGTVSSSFTLQGLRTTGSDAVMYFNRFACFIPSSASQLTLPNPSVDDTSVELPDCFFGVR